MSVDIAYLFFAVFIPCRRGRGSEWGTRFRLPPFDIYTECFYSFLLWNTFINFSWTILYYLNSSLYKAYFIWKLPGVWPWMAYLHLDFRLDNQWLQYVIISHDFRSKTLKIPWNLYKEWLLFVLFLFKAWNGKVDSVNIYSDTTYTEKSY